MILVVVIVFVAVFSAVVLLLAGMGAGTSPQHKQVLERLDWISTAARRRPEDEGLSILREELLSTIPFLNRWLHHIEVFPRLHRYLSQADLAWTVSGFLVMSAGFGVAASLGAYWRTSALLFSLAIGSAASTIPFLFAAYKRSRRFGSVEEKLPEALDLMVRALRAGHSLTSAIEMVAKEMPNPIAQEFKMCFDEQNFGLELREAMTNLAERVPLHDMHIVVTAILIQKESGGNLAEVLEKASMVIRERFRLKRQVRVFTAQGRLTGWILALLPVVLGTAMYLMNPEYMSRLWQDPTGLKLMYAAGIMTIIGGLIIRNIVRIRI